MYTAEECRKKWFAPYEANKEAIDKRIVEGIKKNRKGHCQIRLTDDNGNGLAGKKIKVNQIYHDFKYGANIFMLDELDDKELNERYKEEFKKAFNLATVPFYWKDLEVEQGKPRYSKHSEKVWRRPAPDLCMNFCEENGIIPKLHCLVYEAFTPDWLVDKPLDEVKALYEKRMKEIAERYGDRLFEVEVINEVLCEHSWKQGTKTALSEQWDIVNWSFEAARKYFPDDVLVINEANPIPGLAKMDYRSGYFMEIENALLKGAEIDKIALQHHIFTGASTVDDEGYEKAVLAGSELLDPTLLFKGLDIASKLDLPLEISEITVPTFGDTEEYEELQADMLKLLYSVFFSHENVDTLVYWNVPDGYAWAPAGRNWNENKCRGGLLHHDMTPKKAFLAMEEMFSKTWRTELELVTDEDGYVEFDGFYGTYELETEGDKTIVGIHRGCDNAIVL